MLKQNIIAIGGSSGALPALKVFFDFSTLNNASYIVIRHLPANYQSQLGRILKLHTMLQVVEAVHSAILENGKIYYAPPSHNLLLSNGYLELLERSGCPNHPINTFLESLAFHHNQAKSIAIILSGKGDDGVKGAAAIVNSGGLVIVQAPESCVYPALPEAVIKSGNADFVLPPGEIPIIINEYINQSGF